MPPNQASDAGPQAGLKGSDSTRLRKKSAKQIPEQGQHESAPETGQPRPLPLVKIIQPVVMASQEIIFKRKIFDEAATAVINCVVAYQRKSGDNETFVKVLEQTLSLAGSVEVKKRIEENIKIGRDNLAGKKVDGVFALLKSIKESKDKPAARLSRFQSEVIPVIVEAAGISGYSESHGYLSGAKTEYSELFDSAAIVLRDISLAAWNEYEDKTTAIHANKLAIQHAIGAELKQRLLEDRATLQKDSIRYMDGPGWQQRRYWGKSSNVASRHGGSGHRGDTRGLGHHRLMQFHERFIAQHNLRWVASGEHTPPETLPPAPSAPAYGHRHRCR